MHVNPDNNSFVAFTPEIVFRFLMSAKAAAVRLLMFFSLCQRATALHFPLLLACLPSMRTKVFSNVALATEGFTRRERIIVMFSILSVRKPTFATSANWLANTVDPESQSNRMGGSKWSSRQPSFSTGSETQRASGLITCTALQPDSQRARINRRQPRCGRSDTIHSGTTVSVVPGSAILLETSPASGEPPHITRRGRAPLLQRRCRVSRRGTAYLDNATQRRLRLKS